MNSKDLITFVAVFAIILMAQVQAQFWKLNNLSERELFILETKATMAAGICYKEVPATSTDPSLRLQTISYCCVGYTENQSRNRNTRALQCDPICTEDCSNGICTAPDVCECYPGYARLGGRCEEL